jgi:hypothetical protein
MPPSAARREEWRRKGRKKSEGRRSKAPEGKSIKYEGGKRLRRSSSALRDYGVMKSRVTGGEVDSRFSYFCLHPFYALRAKFISWLS